MLLRLTVNCTSMYEFCVACFWASHMTWLAVRQHHLCWEKRCTNVCWPTSCRTFGSAYYCKSRKSLHYKFLFITKLMILHSIHLQHAWCGIIWRSPIQENKMSLGQPQGWPPWQFWCQWCYKCNWAMNYNQCDSILIGKEVVLYLTLGSFPTVGLLKTAVTPFNLPRNHLSSVCSYIPFLQ